MKSLYTIFLVTSVMLLSSQNSIACTCSLKPPPCYAYSEYDAVFIGTVKNIQKNDDQMLEKAEITVDQNFKGMNTKTAYTYNYGTSCDFRFKPGDKFLFYGNLFEKEKDHFGTNFCTLTTRYDEKLIDLDFLNSLKSSIPNYWIWGNVMDGYRPLSGVKAQIFDGTKKLSAKSDDSGNFKIPVAKEGTYKVTVSIPERKEFNINELLNSNYWDYFRKQKKYEGEEKPSSSIEYQIEVKANQCGWFSLPMQNKVDN